MSMGLIYTGVKGLDIERCHVGAYAEPMEEHILAMTLALAKQLLKNHNKLAQGEFNQYEINKMVSGSTVGIIGCGGLNPSAQACLRWIILSASFLIFWVRRTIRRWYRV